MKITVPLPRSLRCQESQSMVIVIQKGGWREVEEGKEGG